MLAGNASPRPRKVHYNPQITCTDGQEAVKRLTEQMNRLVDAGADRDNFTITREAGKATLLFFKRPLIVADFPTALSSH